MKAVLSLRLDNDLLATIQQAADQQGCSGSALVRQVLLEKFTTGDTPLEQTIRRIVREEMAQREKTGA